MEKQLENNNEDVEKKDVEKKDVEKKDDGSLDFLNIPRNEASRSFNCPIVNQSKIVNTSFWVVDYIENVSTRYARQKNKRDEFGNLIGQTLVKIKEKLDAPESEARKFFTGSDEILYVLQAIKQRRAFPRKVTLRSNGNIFYFE